MGPELSGLLSDVNIQGHFVSLVRRLDVMGLRATFDELGIRYMTFADLQIPPSLPDRDVWSLCQPGGWVLFTENRNYDGPDSLEATLEGSWNPGDLPVLTLANKDHFMRDRAYADRVAAVEADLLFGINDGEFRDQPRIFVPR